MSSRALSDSVHKIPFALRYASEYGTDTARAERNERLYNRKPNAELLEHERKREIELKCVEMQDLMEEQGCVAQSHLLLLLLVPLHTLVFLARGTVTNRGGALCDVIFY
jgi:hypothetical protein